MGGYLESVYHELDRVRERLNLKVIKEIEEELKPFFEKYPKVSAVLFANEWRGDDEGESWLQFQFYVEIDGKQQDSCDYYDDDAYISEVVEAIPLKLEDMVNIFGTDEIVFENENAEYKDDVN